MGLIIRNGHPKNLTGTVRRGKEVFGTSGRLKRERAVGRSQHRVRRFYGKAGFGVAVITCSLAQHPKGNRAFQPPPCMRSVRFLSFRSAAGLIYTDMERVA
jgi:hypothetical protein